MKLFLLGTILLLAQQSLATISNMKVSNDSSSVMYSYSYSGTPGFLRVFLDTDRNASTGAIRLGIGADYLIENGNFYKYSGVNGAWGWTLVSSSAMLKPSAGNVNWKVSRSAVGNPSAINVVFQIESPLESSAIVSQVLTVTSPSPTPTPTPTPSSTSWTRCATEGGICSFSGTRQVRYGANNIYAYKDATSSIACDNATFGDPVVGAVKYCDYSSTVLVSSSPSPTPTPTPTPTSPSGSVTQLSYGVNLAQIPNPERGFYRQFDCVSNTISTSTLASWKSADNITMVLCNGYLTAFKTSPISQATLDRLQANFDAIRAGGAKIVLRFAYTQNATLGDDATPAQVSAHLDQLKPLLQKNGDVIATMQAGFVGAWGEWDSSANFGFYYNRTAQNWADRKALTDKLLAVLPANRTVSHHMVYDKQRLYSITTPLTSSEAYQNTPKARIGYHDDCFLASDSDMGTYTNKSTEFPFIAEDTKYLPIGGETCKLNAPRSSCSTAQSEMSALHWSYLNLSYNTQVLDSWRTEGCFENVKAKLGYRFLLKSASLSNGAQVGGSISVALNVVNDGYASPYNPRGLEIILRNNSTGAVFHLPMAADPRRWLPGSVISVQQTLALPAGMPAGNYSVLLNLPDPAPLLYGKPQYSIQLANTGVWEASTGFNNLGHVLNVSP